MVKGTNTQIDAGRIYYALNLDIANRRGESKRAYHNITQDFESELEHFNIEHTQHVILDKLT
jgi:hypothetical protein